VLGFKVSAAKIEHGATDSEVTHGNWFVLADRLGAIRGYYSTEDDGDLDKLAGDVARLEKEKP
jgi:hypothetical protein